MKVTRVIGHPLERPVGPFAWQVGRPGSGDGRRPDRAYSSVLRVQTQW